MAITVSIPDPVNRALLDAELGNAGFTAWRVNDVEVTVFDAEATQQSVEAVTTAHNASNLTAEQQIQAAAAIAIQNGKTYLRQQYLSANPNLSTIYTTLSNAVAGNTNLQQIMNNQIAAYQLETGHNLSSITTNADRARYIECCRRVIALLT